MGKYAEWVEKYIKYSNIKIETETFIKITSSLPIVFLILGLVLYLFFGWIYCIVPLVILLVVEGIIHLTLVIVSNKRASLTEEMLPDALRLISSNLRAGLIPEKALLMSARPEFGPLSEQINEAGKFLIVGRQIKDAFEAIPLKINSSVLRKTSNLIVEGIVKGSSLSLLLEGLADDIKSSSMLKKEIKAQVTAYSMFIFLALGFGAPLLYSASLFLTETLIGLGTVLPDEAMATGAIQLTMSGVNLSKEFLLYYSIAMMIISSIFGGILIGLIQEGRELAGLKYIGMLLVIDMTLFYIIKFIILSSFAVF